MGKRGNRRENEGNRMSSSSGFHTSLSLREEASGKKQSHSSKSILKLKHFQNLAQWSAAQTDGKDDGSLGCLGAFFGCRFAEFGEALGIPPDHSLFLCQSCETILQPGFNCTVRVEKNRAKSRRRSKTKTPVQNNVVYTCSFCLHRNLKRGTSKGYMRVLSGSKAIYSKSKSANSVVPSSVTLDKSNVSHVKTDKPNEATSPLTGKVSSSSTDNSLVMTGAKLMDSKPRKRKKPVLKGSADESVANSAQVEREKCSGTSKRKRPWTSLKDIAESEKLERNQSCETILQPGFNCTVRVEKNRAKSRRRSKTKTPVQNNVVYTCSFCLHRNLKRGTSKGYMRVLSGSKAIYSKSKSANSVVPSSVTLDKSNVSHVKTDKPNEATSPLTGKVSSSSTDNSLVTTGAKLLDSKPRKRKKPVLKGSADESVANSAQAEREKCSGTSKRKRPWTSLKDIAESEKLERNQRFKNFSIPFVL